LDLGASGSRRHLNRTLHLIKSHDCLAGVVINPATPVDTLAEVLDMVDYVLVMSVNPGFGGQKFIPGALHKMRQLAEIRSQRRLAYRIEVDGGVALDTVGDVVRAGRKFWWRATRCSARMIQRRMLRRC
jgi:ribulose-phosphate 3-epimerase